MKPKDIKTIIRKAYPQIVKDLGKGKKGTPPIELHKDIYARLSGDPEAMGEASKTSKAEYDWDNNKIYIYYPNMVNEEDVLRSLLHEHTHTLQDHRKNEKYREMGYKNNPHEIESRKAEDNWKKYKQ